MFARDGGSDATPSPAGLTSLTSRLVGHGDGHSTAWLREWLVIKGVEVLYIITRLKAGVADVARPSWLGEVGWG